MGILLLVRHADAGDKRRWDAPDLLRPLSPTGWSQATGLVERLQDYPIERIMSSPAVRCQQTVQPLARDRYLPIESSPNTSSQVHAHYLPPLALDHPSLPAPYRRGQPGRIPA